MTGRPAASVPETESNQAAVVLRQEVVEDPLGAFPPQPASSSGTTVGEAGGAGPVAQPTSAYSKANIRSGVCLPCQYVDSMECIDKTETEDDKRALQEVQQYSAVPTVKEEGDDSDDNWGEWCAEKTPAASET